MLIVGLLMSSFWGKALLAALVAFLIFMAIGILLCLIDVFGRK